MKPIPVVRSTAYRVLLDSLSSLGIDWRPYLAEVGISERLVAEQDRLLPERPAWLMLDLVRERERMDDLGFRVGLQHSVTDLEDIGPLLTRQPTLAAAIRTFCSQLVSHANTWDFWTEDQPGGVRICRRGTPMDVGRWVLEQYAIAYLTDLVRLAAPVDWRPDEIWLKHTEPLSPAEKSHLSGAHLHPGAGLTAILVPRALLPLRLRADSQAPPAFVTEPIATDIVPVFRSLVRDAMVAGRPRLEQMTSRLGLEARTLQRHLKAEGTSYRHILNEVRLEEAEARLAESEVPIARIATDLGYREPAAFTKAFHRWAGVAPRAYRHANRAQA